MSDRPVFTYQTRLVLDATQASILDAVSASWKLTHLPVEN